MQHSEREEIIDFLTQELINGGTKELLNEVLFEPQKPISFWINRVIAGYSVQKRTAREWTLDAQLFFYYWIVDSEEVNKK
jgi:hypothetical protein